MTNKIPVVGKRYRAKIIDPNEKCTYCKGATNSYTSYMDIGKLFCSKDCAYLYDIKYDLPEPEINKVERALEELKEILEEIKFPIGIYDFDKKVKERSMIVRVKAQNLVNALEAEKTLMSKQEPKWLPMCRRIYWKMKKHLRN
jgi:hypothetical protein